MTVSGMTGTDIAASIALFADDEKPVSAFPSTSWPSLPAAALYGLPGDIVKAIEPYSEADSAAHLVHVLGFTGCAMGSSAYVRVGSTRHWARLFALIVGKTSRARKGTAGDDVGLFIERAAPEFWSTRR